MNNFYKTKFKVSELIEKLKEYNQDAYVVGVFDYVGYGLNEITWGGSDGCTKESCDEVNLHFGDNEPENEKERL